MEDSSQQSSVSHNGLNSTMDGAFDGAPGRGRGRGVSTVRKPAAASIHNTNPGASAQPGSASTAAHSCVADIEMQGTAHSRAAQPLVASNALVPSGEAGGLEQGLEPSAAGSKRPRRGVSVAKWTNADSEDDGGNKGKRASSKVGKNASATARHNDAVSSQEYSALGSQADILSIPMGPLPRLSASGYTSYGGAYDYEHALAEDDVPMYTGDPKATIPGSDLTEGEFAALSEADQKKQRRLIRNRLSAQMHRQRQRAHIDALETQVTELSVVIDELRSRLLAAVDGCGCGHVMCTGHGGAALPKPSGTAGSAGKPVTVPAALLTYTPPHVPGILGYTGAAGERVEGLRTAVLRGLLGPAGAAASAARNLSTPEGQARLRSLGLSQSTASLGATSISATLKHGGPAGAAAAASAAAVDTAAAASVAPQAPAVSLEGAGNRLRKRRAAAEAAAGTAAKATARAAAKQAAGSAGRPKGRPQQQHGAAEVATSHTDMHDGEEEEEEEDGQHTGDGHRDDQDGSGRGAAHGHDTWATGGAQAPGPAMDPVAAAAAAAVAAARARRGHGHALASGPVPGQPVRRDRAGASTLYSTGSSSGSSASVSDNDDASSRELGLQDEDEDAGQGHKAGRAGKALGQHGRPGQNSTDYDTHSHSHSGSHHRPSSSSPSSAALLSSSSRSTPVGLGVGQDGIGGAGTGTAVGGLTTAIGAGHGLGGFQAVSRAPTFGWMGHPIGSTDGAGQPVVSVPGPSVPPGRQDSLGLGLGLDLLPVGALPRTGDTPPVIAAPAPLSPAQVLALPAAAAPAPLSLPPVVSLGRQLSVPLPLPSVQPAATGTGLQLMPFGSPSVGPAGLPLPPAPVSGPTAPNTSLPVAPSPPPSARAGLALPTVALPRLLNQGTFAGLLGHLGSDAGGSGSTGASSMAVPGQSPHPPLLLTDGPSGGQAGSGGSASAPAPAPTVGLPAPMHASVGPRPPALSGGSTGSVDMLGLGLLGGPGPGGLGSLGLPEHRTASGATSVGLPALSLPVPQPQFTFGLGLGLGLPGPTAPLGSGDVDMVLGQAQAQAQVLGQAQTQGGQKDGAAGGARVSTSNGHGSRLAPRGPAGLVLGSLALVGTMLAVGHSGLGQGGHGHGHGEWMQGQGAGEPYARRLASSSPASVLSGLSSYLSGLASLAGHGASSNGRSQALGAADLGHRLDRALVLLEQAQEQAHWPVQQRSTSSSSLASDDEHGSSVAAAYPRPGQQYLDVMHQGTQQEGQEKESSAGPSLHIPLPFTTRGASLRASMGSSTSSGAGSNGTTTAGGAGPGAVLDGQGADARDNSGAYGTAQALPLPLPLPAPVPATLELRLGLSPGQLALVAGVTRDMGAAGARLGRALSRLIRLGSGQGQDGEDGPEQHGQGDWPQLLLGPGSTGQDGDQTDLPLHVSSGHGRPGHSRAEARLVRALQAYADAALTAYRQAQLAANTLARQQRGHEHGHGHEHGEEGHESDEERRSDQPAGARASASFVLCPDPLASLAGLPAPGPGSAHTWTAQGGLSSRAGGPGHGHGSPGSGSVVHHKAGHEPILLPATADAAVGPKHLPAGLLPAPVEDSSEPQATQPVVPSIRLAFPDGDHEGTRGLPRDGLPGKAAHRAADGERPFLLLLVPGDTAGLGRGLGGDQEGLHNGSGGPRIDVTTGQEGGNSNSTARIVVNSTSKRPSKGEGASPAPDADGADSPRDGHAEDSQQRPESPSGHAAGGNDTNKGQQLPLAASEGPVGWLELGCEVVSLRRVAGLELPAKTR